ncbi:MAG: D-aminoacyl-tRNA deacylase [Defluviitoga tunisiensis]|uniref:D-aminoacyl-tRNA deacylase n=1 Tax=Defluviitoga tunisiensis TaxID=1006576 RepID=A0A0C7P2X6_DEFTU|nr:D-aminoacyl-tRNA deacylase [Defluviitoga tunisiensis]MDD3600139.1 D-aminoacyl-tRNA deacylase [Defluviitoga tunisiensis]MDY0379233.1 D-aminoacyl-tRNA deacylase [Defluviitoga tunisiensis]CEP78685.1 D-tyrosyl-tRNA(Tyr) deacylase [Defluviitoga tunisiensis]HHV01909.1 D-tyrosyl-tRNA(Tyr) deacylase [Defluviitoga tunisiensis]HOB54705.1 D-aminoacyl-tRNA deacylase [Defluviitoga tunisiensis]
MRAVVQRVKQSSVIVDDEIVAEIGKGLLVLLGISKDDGINDIKWLADKIVHLRIFEDELGKMNKSVLEVGGELLVVSQFTLYGDCRKGRRPSFSESATPDIAQSLYNNFLSFLTENYNINVKNGIFQAQMIVNIVNDGPVTLLLDSKKQF